MMVHEEAEAIFLGTTKAASRNLYRELEDWNFRLVGKRHWNTYDLAQHATVSPEGSVRNYDWWQEIGGWAREWKFFCTIRDPYHWLLSHYCWNPLSGKHPLTEPIPLSWIQTLEDRFPAYVPRTTIFHKQRRLWRFLYFPGCWRVMKLETLNQDLLGVLGELGLTGELGHLLRTDDQLETKTLNKPPGDPRQYFSAEALAWFRYAYADELKATGYE